MSWDDHPIGNVLKIVQGKPYDRFQKITHISILRKKNLLEFTISQMRIQENSSVLAEG
jgi:hypothetical protein